MATRLTRKIVHIDEEKCNGCGLCVPSCAEGALQVIDGKAKLVSEIYCDGLGACLGECPQGAISIEEKEAEGFNEEATKYHLEHMALEKEVLPCGCPSSTVKSYASKETEVSQVSHYQPSALEHWPVQLRLVPATAPFLRGADVLLAADCVPFACAGFHQDFLKGKVLLVACPKLDDFATHQKKLTEILKQSDVKSLTVVHMEVPCCSGLVYMAEQAIEASSKRIPLKEVTISVKGEVLS